MTFVEHWAVETNLADVAIRNTEFLDAAMILSLLVVSFALLEVELTN